MELLRHNSAALGSTPSAMVGRLLDDKFGGMLVGSRGGTSPRAIQQHIETLESMLRPKSR